MAAAAQSLTRRTLGMCASADGERLCGAAVAASGNGLRMRLKLVAAANLPLPPHLTQNLLQLQKPGGSDGVLLSLLRQEMADQMVQLAALLTGRLEEHAAPLSIGVGDWLLVDEHHPGALPTPCSICDTHRLAELTGLTVVDDFAARDLAAGGNGMVLSLLPYWLLLADRSMTAPERIARVLIERLSTSEEFRMTYLPPHAVLADWLPPVHCETVSSAEAAVDLLLERTSPRADEPPLWPEVAGAVFDDPIDFDWHSAVQTVLPHGHAVPLADFHFDSDSLPAAAWATLALLHLDQAPANMPHMTGAETRRLLGRLTPGSPHLWSRLLREMHKVQPETMSLLRAI
ncbi:anhydro-N-acetylmuramic acid kinase [Lignipirellula cremea]|uniref:Anhydro-N-acetylmuramic acid kinase n=1 Tax=Lignipirellula cremea TaxID=2528010 RepID=A0A518DSA4_9BACT|nr:anhydro-N-acetylmuramic acid kinase [Lignipirellula cremea]QDU94726.1 anhydro-N-acetylmuramic acid kinase [Lignipirellula cremea]